MSDKVEKIKFVSIYSISQKSFVCEYYTVEKYQSFHEEYIGFINDNLLMKPITEKQSVYGMWRTKCDEQFYYIALTHPSYSERLCGELFSELSKKAIELNTTSGEQIQTQFVKEIVKKYLKPTEAPDALSIAQEKVVKIGEKMQDNIINVIGGGEKLNEMQDQANEMRVQAEQFNQKAQDLKRMMRCRNIKLWVILGVVIIAVLLYIILPIVIKKKS